MLEADHIQLQIQGLSCDTYASIEVVALRTQVVAGTNYSVKYRVTGADEVFVDHEGTHQHGSAGSIVQGDGTVEHGESYILVKIFVPLPHMNALPEVTGVQKVQVTETSPVRLQSGLLHREECPADQPAEPTDPSSGDDSVTGDYEAWKSIMDRWGYTFKAYEVTTEDGWILTLFRITGYTDQPERTYADGTKPIFV